MEITKIDPPFWFTGLKSNELTLFVYGKGLKDIKVKTSIPYKELSWNGNDNNLQISLILDEYVAESTYTFTLSVQRETYHFEYEFKRHREWIFKEPTISNKDTVYLVMPDRFAKGGCGIKELDTDNPNGWHGGNIAGMTESLDYLTDLGITALWHTPVFKNSAYHGYSIIDFYDIDKHFGNIEEYKQFVEEAHKKGIKVVMDFVYNHCSIEHPWIQNPPTEDWFNGMGKKPTKTNYKITTIFDPHASTVDKRDTVKGWFTEEMPDLNLQCKATLCYLAQMTKWWIEVTGIDAIRMDTYLYSDLGAMIEWQNELSKEYPNISIIAETWVPDAAYTSKIQNEVYPKLSNQCSLIVMDFAFQKKLEQYLDKKKVYDKESSVYYHFVYDFLYTDAQNTLAFLDNHDLPRWCDCIKSKAKLIQALGILFTVPRIPQLYYGTEFMISNDGKRMGDGSYRVDTFEQIKCKATNEVSTFIKAILNWRKKSRAIEKGSMKHFVPQNGVYVYFRTCEEEKIMVISNGLSKLSHIDFAKYKEELNGYTSGVDIITNKHINFNTHRFEIRQNEILILNLIK